MLRTDWTATSDVTGTTISGNTAYYGGGVHSFDGTLTIAGSTISGNNASIDGHGYGGALYNDGAVSNVTISGSTLAMNTAAKGSGGIFNTWGNVMLRSTIVAANWDTNGDPDVGGSPFSMTDAQFSLIGDVGAMTVTDLGNNQIGGGANPTIDALLGPLQNNGGPTETHELLPGSPAIDAGSSFGQTTDQRGEFRTVDIPGINDPPPGDSTDIGAFEVALPANQPPDAVDDVAGEATVSEDGGPGPVDITSAILANDFDPDSDPLTVVAIDDSSITAGILDLTSGVVTFDPNGQFESLGVGQSATQTFTYTIDDGISGQDTATVDLVINGVNDDPTVAADNDPVSVNEGLVANNSGSFDDIDNPDNVTIAASDGTITFQDAGNSGSWSWQFNSTDGPSESQLVTITADDGNVGEAQTTFQLDVVNVPPTITAGSLNVPLDPVDINDQATFTVDFTFSDPAGSLDQPYTCTFDMDSDSTADTPISVTGVTGTSCSTTLAYAEPGVYTVTATVTDKDGGVSDAVIATAFIVIYDPDGGFVTGGGWINSPEGACTFEACTEDTTGKANFGFVSRYKKGASVPTGNTEFQFQAGNLNFHSTSYDWLVIAGAKAMYKGDGRVNGVDGYTFQLNAIDGQINGGGGVDKFRIKIKDTGGGVIYDNQMGGGDNDDPTTALGGGSIKIHKPNNLVLDADQPQSQGMGTELTQPMLDAAVSEGIAYWAWQGASPQQLDILAQQDVRITDLSGSTLGSAVPTDGTIWIDRDAAGFGWDLTMLPETVSANGVDLLSAVAHELGHVLGYEHDVLESSLSVGSRQLPALFLIPGDANRDGLFDRLDLIEVLQAGKYLTDQTATWREGDWNADGLFDQRDIVSALQAARVSVVADEVVDQLFSDAGAI